MKTAYAIALMLTLLLMQCTDDADTPVRPTAVFQYKVYCYDQFGYNMPSYEGVTVSAVAGEDVFTAQTDADGIFRMELPTGVYDIHLDKPGFESAVYPGIPAVGGGEPTYGSLTINQLSTVHLEEPVLTFTDAWFTLEGSLKFNDASDDSQMYPTHLVAYISTSPDVSSTHYTEAQRMGVRITSGDAVQTTFRTHSVPLTTGTTIYAVIYAIARYEVGSYDFNTHSYIYPSRSVIPTATLSVVIP